MLSAQLQRKLPFTKAKGEEPRPLTWAAWGAWVLPLLCASCGDATSERALLEGRSFLLESAQGIEFVPDTRLSVSFEDDQIIFSAGCNAQSGPFELKDGRLVLQGLSTTDIGCFGALGMQDDWLAQFMTSQPRFDLMGQHLTLRGLDASLILLDREVADPDRPLADTVFMIDSFLEGDGVGSGSSMGPATVVFHADGSLNVETTCSTGVGRYEVSGSQITLSSVVYTDKACNSPAAPTDARVEAILSDGVLDFTMEAARITLKRGEVGLSGRSS